MIIEDIAVPGGKDNVFDGVHTVHGTGILELDCDRGELPVSSSCCGDAVGARVHQDAEVRTVLVCEIITLPAVQLKSVGLCGIVV